MRQLHLAIAIAAAIGMTTSISAQEEGKKPGEGKAGTSDIRARLLKEFDADGDGKLDEGEQAKAKAAAAKLRDKAGAAGRPDKAQMLKQFDKDGDGQLSEAERAAIREFMSKRGAAGNATDQRPAGDGDRIPAEVLKKFDKDGDGKLNEGERKAAMQAREEFMKKSGAAGPGRDIPNKEELIKKFDKNGDGELDDSEQAAAREAFAKMRAQRGNGAAPAGSGEARKPRVDKKALLEKFDADGDGKLNDEERAKAVEEFKKRDKE